MVHYAAFGIFCGTGNMIVGNHWFHGDDSTNGTRQAGLIFTTPNTKSTVTGNYVDNNFIELTNEHDATPDFGNQFSFGGLTITGNIFTANNVAPWFRWLMIKPYGTGHYIHGLTVLGNTFRTLNGSIGRVEGVDTSFADLDMSRARNVLFEGNTFNGIDQFTSNPVSLDFAQSSNAGTWVCDFGGWLPFEGNLRTVSSFVKEGRIRNSSNGTVTAMPYMLMNQGSTKDHLHVIWPEDCNGKIHVVGRMDKPT